MMNYLRSILRIIKTTIITAILILLVAFMINNRQVVELKFYPLNFVLETRLFILVTISILVGLFIGFLLFGFKLLFCKFSKQKQPQPEENKL